MKKVSNSERLGFKTFLFRIFECKWETGIMSFSGHRTEASFRKYLKMDAEANTQKYADFFLEGYFFRDFVWNHSVDRGIESI